MRKRFSVYPWLFMLGIIFIILKLCGTITWSWWFVLMPIYIPMSLGFLAIMGIMFVCFWIILESIIYESNKPKSLNDWSDLINKMKKS